MLSNGYLMLYLWTDIKMELKYWPWLCWATDVSCHLCCIFELISKWNLKIGLDFAGCWQRLLSKGWQVSNPFWISSTGNVAMFSRLQCLRNSNIPMFLAFQNCLCVSILIVLIIWFIIKSLNQVIAYRQEQCENNAESRNLFFVAQNPITWVHWAKLPRKHSAWPTHYLS